jgi:hypothetical protein
MVMEHHPSGCRADARRRGEDTPTELESSRGDDESLRLLLKRLS